MDENGRMTPEELIRFCEARQGIVLRVEDDGLAHVRPVVPGGGLPAEIYSVKDQFMAQSREIARLLLDRARVELVGISRDETADWLGRVRIGEFRLVPGTKVTYVRETGLTDMMLERVPGFDLDIAIGKWEDRAYG